MDLTIDWAAFALVLGVALAAAVGISLFYSMGLRLLAVGSPDGAGTRSGSGSGSRSPGALLGAGVCFAVCIGAVLFGLWLIIPQFH